MISSRRERLLIIFLVVTFIVVFSLGYNGFNIARSRIIAGQEKSLTELAGAVETFIINHWIKPREKAITTLSSSRMLRSRIRGDVDREILLNEWLPVFNYLGDVFFIYYADTTGFMEFYPPGTLPPGYNALERPWYLLGMANPGRVQWGEPYEEAVTGKTVISTVRTIDDPGSSRVHGVIAMDISLVNFEKMLKTIILPQGGSIYIFHETGTLLARTERENDYTAFLKGLMADPEVNLAESNYYHHNGKDLFANMLRIPGTGWIMFILVPRDTLLAEINPIKTNAVIAALFILILSFIFFNLLSYYQKKKVSALINYFLEIGGGSEHIRELFTEKDEFFTLNREFNKAMQETRNAEAQRLLTEKRYRELVENAPMGIFQSNRDGSFLSVNYGLASMLGYTDVEETLKAVRNVQDLYVSPADRQRLIILLQRYGFVRDYQVQLKRKDGGFFWASINARGKTDGEGQIEHISGFVTDISEQIHNKELLEQLANTDGLTKINNRRRFMELSQQEVNRYSRYGGTLSLLIIDIDHFKRVNDTYGHDMGDKVLKEFAQLILNSIRDTDIFGRIGGEEFALLMPETAREGAISTAERLRQKISEEIAIPHTLGTIRVTVSIGVSSLSNGPSNLEDLIKKADLALYQAKGDGRNCVRYL